jgi:hypothetical protein
MGGEEILWGKRNFGDCKRIFEQVVVEACTDSFRIEALVPEICSIFCWQVSEDVPSFVNLWNLTISAVHAVIFRAGCKLRN